MLQLATATSIPALLSGCSGNGHQWRTAPLSHCPLSPEDSARARSTLADRELTEAAHRLARDTFGASRLSEAHDRALFYIAARMTHMVTGHARREFGNGPVRLSYGLQCGGGKTLSAKAWLAAVHMLGRRYSALYAANEVEALCGVKRDLVESFGVPEERVGLLHSLGNKASLPATPRDRLDDCQFLLVSHNMVRTGERNLALFNVYSGRPRDIVIYDESLIVSDAWSVSNKAIREGVDYLKREEEFSGREDLVPVRRYAEDTLSAFLAEADAQQATGRLPELVSVPELTDYGRDLHPDAAKALLPRDCPGPVRTLLDATGREVRVVSEGSRGVAWFVNKVPDELGNVFVLDASHLIRALSRLGGTNIVEDPAAVSTGIRYEALTVEYFRAPAGYRSIVEECRKPVGSRTLLAKLADWIESRPDGERVNVWTFKRRSPNDPDPEEKLRQGLTHHGVNPDRINVLTHGRAKGSNEFASAPHTAFYGVFEQNKLGYAGQVLGQSGDLLADLQQLEQLHKTEILHDVFQEIARSGVRKIERGRAGRGSVFFPCWHTDVAEQLGDARVFPGAQLIHREDLEDRPAAPAEPPKYRLVAESILAALLALGEETRSLGAARLKPAVSQRVGFEVPERVWKDAVAALSEDTLRDLAPYREDLIGPTSLSEVGWKRTPRGFARLAAGDYGL